MAQPARSNSPMSELDAIAMRILQLMQQSIDMRVDLETRMRAAWLQLARTRSLLGAGAIENALRDEREVQAKRTVSIDESSDVLTFELAEQSGPDKMHAELSTRCAEFRSLRNQIDSKCEE